MPEAEAALPGRQDAVWVADRHFVTGNPMVGPFPAEMEQAIFGLGCFWGAERKFWQVPGVFTTAVGYAGGFTPNPSYEEVCTGLTGHNEVVLVVYEPDQVNYESLLRVFWESHDPTQGMRQGNDRGTQYRSGIYTATDAQKIFAKASKEAYAASIREAGYGPITTEILDAPDFLLRRGQPPAIPGQKPDGLLRARWNRGGLPALDGSVVRFSAVD
ncbi:MAG: peptide-methionine (S)-S-oxide reductase MsrA [Pseudomonadota bacterium]